MRRPAPTTGKRWTQTELARVAAVSRQTIWSILEAKADAHQDTVRDLAAALGLDPPNLDVAKGPLHVAERPLRDWSGKDEIEELGDDPDRQGDGPGWQWDSTDYTQLTEDDVLGMLLHDRPGFLRYLQRQFDRPVPTPPAAKLGYLEFVERIAKEKGATVPTEYLETLRRLIRDRSL